MTHSFLAVIELIGINPFVFVPKKILESLFLEAGKNRGHIPVTGTVNGQAYAQTLVKYSGDWRLYINTTMLKDSPKRIGEKIEVVVRVDHSDRTIAVHPKLEAALNSKPQAKEIFEQLSPSRRKEIIKYINNLKTEESVSKSVAKAIDFLLGKTRFVGRDNP